MTATEKEEFRRLGALLRADVIHTDERDRYYELKRRLFQ